MFAAALFLLIVDIITPAATEQWDLSRVFLLLDEIAVRGIITAGPYKQDLVEMNNFRQVLKNDQQQEIPHQEGESYSTNDTGIPISVPIGPDVVPNPNLEQDLIWPWIALDTSELGGLHPRTIQTAINGLNFDISNDPSTVEMGGDEWMWGWAS